MKRFLLAAMLLLPLAACAGGGGFATGLSDDCEIVRQGESSGQKLSCAN